MSSNSLGLIHNTCITLDETHAIDMTRDDPEHPISEYPFRLIRSSDFALSQILRVQ
jgi:hypothetical protein